MNNINTIFCPKCEKDVPKREYLENKHCCFGCAYMESQETNDYYFNYSTKKSKRK